MQSVPVRHVAHTTSYNEAEFIEKWQRLSPWYRGRFMRFLIRLRNEDPKVFRLIKLRDEGFISTEEMFRRM